MTPQEQLFWILTVAAAVCAIGAGVALAWAHFSWPTVIGAGLGAAASALTGLASAWRMFVLTPATQAKV